MIHGRVSMFTFIFEGKVFLQERGKYSKRGEEWSFFGGHLEDNEDFTTGLKREVWEELRLRLGDEDFESIGQFRNYIKGVSEYTSEIFISREYPKYCQEIQVCEGISGGFFSFEDARKLKMFSHDYMVLDNIERFQ